LTHRLQLRWVKGELLAVYNEQYRHENAIFDFQQGCGLDYFNHTKEKTGVLGVNVLFLNSLERLTMDNGQGTIKNYELKITNRSNGEWTMDKFIVNSDW
jgi:hypothetical protein